MSVYLILLLALIVGSTILAHHMGKEIGYEHGYNHARRDTLCRECRMSEGRATITPTTNTNER